MKNFPDKRKYTLRSVLHIYIRTYVCMHSPINFNFIVVSLKKKKEKMITIDEFFKINIHRQRRRDRISISHNGRKNTYI